MKKKRDYLVSGIGDNILWAIINTTSDKKETQLKT